MTGSRGRIVTTAQIDEEDQEDDDDDDLAVAMIKKVE
jgi:hypothetical protein